MRLVTIFTVLTLAVLIACGAQQVEQPTNPTDPTEGVLATDTTIAVPEEYMPALQVLMDDMRQLQQEFAQRQQEMAVIGSLVARQDSLQGYTFKGVHKDLKYMIYEKPKK